MQFLCWGFFGFCFFVWILMMSLVLYLSSWFGLHYILHYSSGSQSVVSNPPLETNPNFLKGEWPLTLSHHCCVTGEFWRQQHPWCQHMAPMSSVLIWVHFWFEFPHHKRACCNPVKNCGAHCKPPRPLCTKGMSTVKAAWFQCPCRALRTAALYGFHYMFITHAH